MKRIRIKIIFFCLFITGITCYSQAPNLISYQTVIRNGNNELVSNTTIGVRISILGGSEANVLVYQEEHTVKTNINGLAYLTIGNGTILNGVFTGIDWSKGPYFIKSETDPTGGKNYTIVVLSQMLSVPYAIYSTTAEKLTGTLPETDPLFNGSIAKGITATDTSYWNRKLNSTDTSRMLANYRTSINNKLDAKDTTLMLSNYLKKSEAVTSGGVETDPVFNGSIAKGITATDTSYWNSKLNSSDTSGMLANYRAGLNQKLNITDTAKMLTPYLRDADTTNMLANYRTSINNKLDAKDTSLMLSNYLKKSEAIASVGVETDPVFNGSIAKGITASDTSHWNKKLNSSDTSGMLANYRTGLNQKLNITDTAKMLTPYLRDADTTNMLANYRTSINNKLDAKDTSLMLSNYLKKSEAIASVGVETDPVFNGSIAKGITASDTSHWNKKLNSSDTSGMLANYRTGLNQKLNITDTAKMLVPYLRDADTTNMLANYRTIINGKLDIKDTSLMLANYLKKVESLNTDLQAILDYINLFRIISGYSYAEIDGYRYKIVRVGNQIWMAENLRTTKYRNGENIVTNYSNWPFYGQYTIGAFAQYNNNDSLGNIYGKLYNWFAVTDSRGICPLGWHIPTIPEWSTLISFLGGLQIAGGKLKFTGTTHWNSPNLGATNESEFSVYPGGQINGYYGGSYDLGNKAYFWSSHNGELGGIYYIFDTESVTVGSDYQGGKGLGFSVRCLRD